MVVEGFVEWPPRSPNLTPRDFLLWTIMKDRVYIQKSHDIHHLEALVGKESALYNSNAELCHTTRRFVTNRCQICINTEDKHFEHLLQSSVHISLINYSFFIVNSFLKSIFKTERFVSSPVVILNSGSFQPNS